MDALVVLPEWYHNTPDNDWAPTFTIATPFFVAAFAEASAKKTYNEIAPNILHSLKTNDVLMFDITLTSSVLHGNDEPGCVIKQRARVIHPLAVNLGPQEVVDVGEEGDSAFRREFRCNFSLSAFKYNEPFTLALVNIMAGLDDTEKDYDLEPSTFR